VPLTRRRFLSGGAAVAGTGLLAACANGVSGARALVGDRRLRVLTWPEYIDTGASGTVARFHDTTGAVVDYNETWDNTASWNDILAPALGAGRPTGWDIVVPTYWVAARLVERGWAEPVPIEVVPNHVNIDPAFLTMGWDRGARYHMPWQAGYTGIAYNIAAVNADQISLGALYDSRFHGKVGMVDQMRETVALTMRLQEEDPSRPTVQAATKALDTIEEAARSGQIRRFTGNEYLDLLRSGEFQVCLAWSGDMYRLTKERPDIRFRIPLEGGIRWFDTMVVPRGAENLAAAARWMDFVYDPTNAAKITSAVHFISPVLGVQQALQQQGGDAATLAQDPILFPDDVTRQRLYTWGTLDIADEERLQARFDRIIGR
jgi:spermidine/putrescine transport system substrate-binding protein